MSKQGARAGVAPRGEALTEGVVSYFQGPPQQWRAGLPSYQRVVYAELWPGIDLVYGGTAGRLKYSFLVAAGADPGQIRLAYRGASGLELSEAGELAVATPLGGLVEERPYVYQARADGGHEAVAAGYALAGDSGAGEQGFGFWLGAYDPGRPLVVDPTVVVYAGYIGGSGADQGRGIAVDRKGNAYVAGQTTSSAASFPETVGPDTSHKGGLFDAFVAKVVVLRH